MLRSGSQQEWSDQSPSATTTAKITAASDVGARPTTTCSTAWAISSAKFSSRMPTTARRPMTSWPGCSAFAA
jgi:hypothetical protein